MPTDSSQLPCDQSKQGLALGPGKDFDTAARLIAEKWRRSYQYNPYWSLKVSFTAPVERGGNTIVGDVGTTKFDPLRLESVDPAMTTFVQPHGNPDFAADIDATDQFADPVQLPMRINDDPTDKDLTRWGISEDREAVVVIPKSLFVEAGILPKAGDKLEDIGATSTEIRTYTVFEVRDDVRWKASSELLYYVLGVDTRRRGS